MLAAAAAAAAAESSTCCRGLTDRRTDGRTDVLPAAQAARLTARNTIRHSCSQRSCDVLPTLFRLLTDVMYTAWALDAVYLRDL